MNKILSIEKATEVASQLNKQKKSVILAGGCFDILHIGHIEYLTSAKKRGDVFFVFLESDENIKKIKGPKRPINTQNDRASILANLSMVDYVIPLPVFTGDKDYDGLVISIKPAIIATTKGDSARIHKERQAGLIKAKVVDVTTHVSNQSTSRLIDILKEI